MRQIQESYDEAVYLENNSDLNELTSSELASHYKQFGLVEGRIASNIYCRSSFVDSIKELGLRSMLEIGPFNRPLVKGNNVRYFEVLDRSSLSIRATEQGLDPSTIPEIDYVDEFGDLASINEKFTAALSSHCIEHQPDLISHLKQVSNLLESNGYYFLVIPDKRFCFDHFIPETTVIEIISNHLEQLTTHRFTNILKHRFETTHNDPVRHWAGDHGSQSYKSDIETTLGQVSSLLDESKTSYVDVHSMFFTPESFQSVMKELWQLKLIDFKVERIYQTVKNDLEFYAVLQRL